MRKAGFDLHEINQLYWKSRDTGKTTYKKGSRDSIEFMGRQAKVYLHGHQIASVNLKKNRLALSSAGWQTPTTKTRLNKLLPSGYITQKKYHWYYVPNTPKSESLLHQYGQGNMSWREYQKAQRKTTKYVPFKNWMTFKTR